MSYDGLHDSQPECNGLCRLLGDVSAWHTYYHPDCPRHGQPQGETCPGTAPGSPWLRCPKPNGHEGSHGGYFSGHWSEWTDADHDRYSGPNPGRKAPPQPTQQGESGGDYRANDSTTEYMLGLESRVATLQQRLKGAERERDAARRAIGDVRETFSTEFHHERRRAEAAEAELERLRPLAALAEWLTERVRVVKRPAPPDEEGRHYYWEMQFIGPCDPVWVENMDAETLLYDCLIEHHPSDAREEPK